MVVDLLVSIGFTPEEVGNFMTRDKEVPIPELGDKSFRMLSQTIGTDWGRKLVDKDLWVNVLLRNRALPNLVVIDDVRFENEYEAIRAEGGQVWRVYRPGTFASTDHPSEGLLEGFEFDETLINDGDVATLEAKARVALLGR